MKNFASRDPLERLRKAPLEGQAHRSKSPRAEQLPTEASALLTVPQQATPPRQTEDAYAWPSGMPYSNLQ